MTHHNLAHVKVSFKSINFLVICAAYKQFNFIFNAL